MKKLCLYAGICLFVSPLLYSSCNEDEDVLPPVTMEGRNTLGCLVNGELWLPDYQFGGISFTAQMPSKNWIRISADNSNSGIDLNLSDTIEIVTNKIYVLKNDTTYSGQYSVRRDGVRCDYRYFHLLSGTTTLLRLDPKARIISGTFEFTTYNVDCGYTIKVTDGRFDSGELTY